MSYQRGYYNQQEKWDSENDSTWDEDGEDEDGEDEEKEKTSHQHNQQRRAPRDMQNYRHGYPDKSPKPNLLFYQNKTRFQPDGEYIDFIHEHWCKEYETLEMNHNFIQWLFPLRERGVNWLATPLTLSEIELMKKDKKVMVRILESYKLMLGFYGIELVDPDTGMVARAEGNWEDRFHNLDNHTHNNLRITRILKCLGEMGYEKLQAPLVRFFLEETLCNGNLPNVKESALDYFMFTVKDKEERKKLVHFAWMNYKPQERFIWGPVDKLRKFNPLPQDAQSKLEADVPGEVKVQIGSEVSGSMPEYRRHGLVRRVPGYIADIVRVCIRFGNRFVNRLFLTFFEWRFWPIRGFFRGCIFWFRGEARNDVRINEGQFSVKTEGTGTGKKKDETVNISEHERLLNDHESNKAEHKEQDVSADGINEGNMEENEKNAKLGIEVNGRECERKPEDGKRSEDWKLLANVKMQENRQVKENYNSEDHSGKITKDIKSTNLASRNKQLKGTEEEEEDDDTEGCEDSDGHTNESRTENCSGTQTANTENQLGETKRYTEMSKIEDNGQSLTVGSEDNNGRNTWAQNTLPETDKAAQVVRDDEKTENEGSSKKPVPPFGGKGYYAENAEISKIEGNRESSNVGSEDDDGLNTETQNTLPETDKAEQAEKYDGKTEDERAANVAQLLQYGGERDEVGNFGISKTEGNRSAMTMGSKDNDGENIRTQNTEQEKDKTEQNERVDHTREDVALDPETEEKANETLKSEGGSRETEDSEIYKGENKQEDDRTVENESEDSC